MMVIFLGNTDVQLMKITKPKTFQTVLYLVLMIYAVKLNIEAHVSLLSVDSALNLEF